MDCQKHHFNLPDDLHYLNCASRGPLTMAVEEAGIDAIRTTTSHIQLLTPEKFFEPAWEVRGLFTTLINGTDPERVAIIPSVSYGMAIVARNLGRKAGLKAGQTILLLEAEFPSDVYAWERVASEYNLNIKTVSMPEGVEIGAQWNSDILEAIDAQTAMVVCPHVHWMYGITFDLEAIGAKARLFGAWLVVDGTQSIGAYPFDLTKIQPDALICASYKWLLGPYSLGLAYLGEVFDEGIPIEETWMGRDDSHLFHQLTDYKRSYRPKAYRYNMGQHSNFIQLPMLKVALEQLLRWQPTKIQDYCQELLNGIIPELQSSGYTLENEAWRASHLVGFRLPKGVNPIDVQKKLSESRIYVSARGAGIRVSPHLYNTEADMQALLKALMPPAKG